MLQSQFSQLTPNQIFEFYLDSRTKGEFERLQKTDKPPKGALEADASALNMMAAERADGRINPKILPNLNQIESFRKTFLANVSNEVDEAICDLVQRLIQARGSSANPLSVIEASLSAAESPAFKDKIAAGTSALVALAELLQINTPLSAAQKVSAPQEISRATALSVYREGVSESDKKALGLPASEAATMIQRYGLTGSEIADVGHAIAEERIAKVAYMVLRDQGATHQGLMQIVRGVAETGNAPTRYQFLVHEFLDPERTDPKLLAKLKDAGRVISFDLLRRFTEYFSLEMDVPSGSTGGESVTDEEESALGLALRKVQRVFGKEGMTNLTDMLNNALRIGQELQTRDLELVLGDDDEVDLQDPEGPATNLTDLGEDADEESDREESSDPDSGEKVESKPDQEESGLGDATEEAVDE